MPKGIYKRKLKDWTGYKINRLTIIGFSHRSPQMENGNYRRYWKAECLCGNKFIIRDDAFLKIKSCGCLQKETARDLCLKRTKHGMSRRGKLERFYKILVGMKRRCTNKNAIDYQHYGGRGIKVCERWQKFENFRDDMLSSYTEHCKQFGERQTTIDRKDVNKNYEPKNCRWATRKEQALNKRK